MQIGCLLVYVLTGYIFSLVLHIEDQERRKAHLSESVERAMKRGTAESFFELEYQLETTFSRASGIARILFHLPVTILFWPLFLFGKLVRAFVFSHADSASNIDAAEQSVNLAWNTSARSNSQNFLSPERCFEIPQGGDAATSFSTPRRNSLLFDSIRPVPVQGSCPESAHA